MEIRDYAALAGIASILIGGANFVIISLARTFWRLTFESFKIAVLERISLVESDLKKLQVEVTDHEKKNLYFRHNFEGVTKNLMAHITSELEKVGTDIRHLADMVELKFEKHELKIKNYIEIDSHDKKDKS